LRFALEPIVFAIIVMIVGIALMLALVRTPLRRIRRNLGALVDGVRGFADGDFSLRLQVTGDDEISDLVSIYNQIGNILREQRNESLQRELLFETVLQASPLAIVLTDHQRRIVFANRAARDLFARRHRLEGINSAIAERLHSLQQFIDGYAEFARLPKPRRELISWRELLESVQRVMLFTLVEPLPKEEAFVDRAQIERVIINLLKNAKEA